MVTLPPTFTATRFPGYFWDVESLTLYSIKSGVLLEMKPVVPNYFNDHRAGYRISNKGQRKFMSLNYLMKLEVKDSVIPAHYNWT
jgi:hypothetical protein